MKKYTDKFLNQNHKLKNAIIGFELEFYMSELSYYKTLEQLNIDLSPVKVWGFRKYHSDFTPTGLNFKIENDSSGGMNCVELITSPLPYIEAKYYLIKIIKFIQTYGYTNDKVSIHFNISFDKENKDLNDLNILKLILNIDEEEIYRVYPNRKGNIYAKSVKRLVPYKEYDYFNIPISIVKNNLRMPNDKYYGINFLHINDPKESQRLEFRYVGGKDYEKNLGNILYFMDRFIINTYDCIDTNFNKEDVSKLEEYLEENISKYKNISKFDNFIIDYNSIQLQIDQINTYEYVSAYYTNIFNKLYNLLDSTFELKECIINYVTQTQTLEVIDAKITSTSTIKHIDLINCDCEGIFENCFFVGSDIKKSQLTKCKIHQSNVDESKILSCKVESSDLINCYFLEGYLNGDMYGGVFRSGDLGPYATLDSNVNVDTDNDNFFDTKYDSEVDKKEK